MIICILTKKHCTIFSLLFKQNPATMMHEYLMTTDNLKTLFSFHWIASTITSCQTWMKVSFIRVIKLEILHEMNVNYKLFFAQFDARSFLFSLIILVIRQTSFSYFLQKGIKSFSLFLNISNLYSFQLGFRLITTRITYTPIKKFRVCLETLVVALQTFL